MKVGVLQFFSWPERRVPPAHDLRAGALDRVGVMDQTGYDCVWLAEHHFNHLLGVSVGPHDGHPHRRHPTSNLRIGTAVSLAGMYHPLRLAEEVAMLDVLSGGRVNWGAGRGNDPIEFDVLRPRPFASATRSSASTSTWC